MKQKFSISLVELNQMIDSNKSLRIIDVRTDAEYLEKHIPMAKNISIENIETINFLPNEIIITTCGKGGGRSENAAELIRSKIKNEIYFLEGGTFGWFENEQ